MYLICMYIEYRVSYTHIVSKYIGTYNMCDGDIAFDGGRERVDYNGSVIGNPD